MSSFNISGISSGIDTNALVEGLMAVERQSVRRMEASQTRATDQIKAWDLISSRLTDVRNSVNAIRTGSGLSSAASTSSDDNVLRATVRNGALPGTYQFRVTQLAAAQQMSSAGLASGTTTTGAGIARITTGFTQRGLSVVSDTFADGSHGIELVSRSGADLTVRLNGVSQTVAIDAGGQFSLDDGNGGTLVLDAGAAVGGGGALQMGATNLTRITTTADTTVTNLVSRLNAAGGPVRGQVIDTGDGTNASHRLILSSRDTGLANAADIDLGGLSLFSGGLSTIRGAADAQLIMGEGAGAITISRPTNSINDAISGVTLDLVGTDLARDVAVVVSADLDARVGSVQKIVDDMNRALSQVRTATRWDVEAQRGAPLVGSSAARDIGNRLSAVMGRAAPAGGSMAVLGQVGITIGADGVYRLDEAKLRTALESDPAGVERLLVGTTDGPDGILDAVHSTLEQLLDKDGRIGTAKEGAEATIRTLAVSISSQEARLELTQQRYVRQFTAMETALAQLQSQSSFLTSALGGGGLGR